jgi:hypothetical protein
MPISAGRGGCRLRHGWNMDRAGRCELHYRALEGDLAGVLKRIAAGGSPCAADAQSWTPLHFAAQEQRAEVTETLLRAGAEVDARDAYGNTPLWRAVFTSRGQGRSSVIYWPPGRILISPTRPVSAHGSCAAHCKLRRCAVHSAAHLTIALYCCQSESADDRDSHAADVFRSNYENDPVTVAPRWVRSRTAGLGCAP